MHVSLILFLLQGILGKVDQRGGSSLMSRIESTLRSQQNTTAIRRILASDCGEIFERRISRASNFTLFLPSDQAFGSLVGLIRSGAIRISCRGRGPRRESNAQSRRCARNPFISFATENRGSLASLVACIPQVLDYHLVPDNMFLVSNGTGSQNSSSAYSLGSLGLNNATVLQTALNSTAFVNLNGTGQVLIVNATDQGNFVNFGVGPPARIVAPNLNVTNSSTNATVGIVQLVDSLLIPPFPLNVTLKIANLTAFGQSVNNTGVLDMAGITVFAPVDAAAANATIDAAHYIIQNDVIYANASLSIANVTNMANETLVITANNNQFTYGNATVIHPNIPISNGVLHIVDSLVSAAKAGSGQNQGAETSTGGEGQAPATATADS
jgi:uncharacterized surface protein with fasciclin (FAS1) repeats